MPTTLSFTHTLSPHLTHYFIRDLGTLLLGIPYHTCNATKVARETTVFLCMCFFSKLWWSACGSASIFHTRLRLDFSALNYHLCRKIVVFSLRVLFVMRLLKTWNIISYTAQVLLLCVTSCLSPLHNYLDGRSQCASDKEKIDWLLNGISAADFQVNVRLFQLVWSFVSLSKRLC